ncbi:GNAT family N-acetyltransferase [Nocardioides daeguensis]|uniref:N-acetyltransferase domain-containing protein n=1 Tax=Nocardioides daeguensis TaxID=908359 RepID=A0ABP6VYX4_9ACTN|nr:GNAT family N-acetyltransferase [Nocardioides daeguensis]MBV6726777.1 GNAT family N-acetyltransferase [Nocardioides daeguensis]MCR1774471.1 GNAT family N-acetyltransferase [Nocardioides daeguensis]
MALDVFVATGAALADWRKVHNAIIPTDPLSEAEVLERSGRHRLTLGYDDGVLVGNATVRPPDGHGTATVIVRILAGHRRHGLGSTYLASELAVARAIGARRIETVVLASNHDGLAFALARGFVEHDRYLLEGDTVPYVDLHLPGEPPE